MENKLSTVLTRIDLKDLLEHYTDRALWGKKMGADEQMKRDIYATHVRFDPTYEAQCDKLRAKGYTIINNPKKETQK